MYLSNQSAWKICSSIGSKLNSKIFVRSLFNPFASKQIETAKDSHSNSLTNTENVFELQHHIVKPSAMVTYSISPLFPRRKKNIFFAAGHFNRCKKRTMFYSKHTHFNFFLIALTEHCFRTTLPILFSPLYRFEAFRGISNPNKFCP